MKEEYTKEFTVAEFSKILNTSVNTAWKKIKKNGLITIKKPVNNREITFVLLNDDQYNNLISENETTNNINNNLNNPNYEDYVTLHEQVNIPQNQIDLVSVIENVMSYSRDMNNQIKDYVDRVINAEKQVKLLEDIEKRKDDEFIKSQAKIKELELKVKELEEKLKYYESKWWNRNVIGKK